MECKIPHQHSDKRHKEVCLAKQEVAHTPTPWTYQGTGNFIGGADRQRVADVYRDNLPANERIANAAYIVRAVNSHEELVEELKAWIQTVRDSNGDPQHLFRLEELLAKAEGKSNE